VKISTTATGVTPFVLWVEQQGEIVAVVRDAADFDFADAAGDEAVQGS
jgi:hypothetical protein